MTTEADTKRAAIIARAQKLRAMTTERGASEAEALAAIQALSRLVAEYNLSASELEIRADAKHCIKDALVSVRSAEGSWSKLGIGIEKLYGTICWLEEEQGDFLGLGFEIKSISIWYYGFPADVAGSITTLTLCSIAVDQALAEMPKRSGAAKRKSFELGMCDRLRERIREMRSRQTGPVQAPGQLVLLKDKLVREEFGKLGIALHRAPSRDVARDQAAYAAGQARGGQVAIDRSIGAQRRSIGHG